MSIEGFVFSPLNLIPTVKDVKKYISENHERDRLNV